MDTNEFLETMMRPETGDAMAFRIDKADPADGRTFSEEAMGTLAENLKAFTMARTFARWKATGKPPTSVTATVTLAWDDDSDLEDGPPWWQVDDVGATPIDGEDRIRASVLN